MADRPPERRVGSGSWPTAPAPSLPAPLGYRGLPRTGRQATPERELPGAGGGVTVVARGAAGN